MSETTEKEELLLVGEKSFDSALVQVYTTPDKLKLYVSVHPTMPGSAIRTSVDHISMVIESVAVGSEPDRNVLENVVATLARGEDVEHRRVARGEPTTPGRDGRVVLLVQQFCAPGKQRQCSEVVDARFIKSFDNVEKGMTFARVMPPAPGKPGRDVFGKPIPPPMGKSAEFRHDDTIALGMEGGVEVLSSKLDGYLTETEKGYHIEHNLKIEGDVSYRTGDIDFIGNVEITGDVQRDFTVAAKESLGVTGNVAHGKLRCRRGNISVGGYVLGDSFTGFTVGEHTNEQMLQTLLVQKEAQVQCAGDFSASILDGASIEALGNVTIEKEARNSSLRTRGSIRGSSARVYGGDLYAVCGIEVLELGNSAGAATFVHACSDVESSAEYANLSDKINGYLSAEQMLEMQLGVLVKEPERLAKLSPTHRANVQKMLKKLQEIRVARAELEAKRTELLSTASRNSSFRVNVLGKAFSGVTILAGEQRFFVEEDINGPATIEHFPETGEFKVGSLRPLECGTDQAKPAKTAE